MFISSAVVLGTFLQHYDKLIRVLWQIYDKYPRNYSICMLD